MAFRGIYWSCSDFAVWLRKVGGIAPKPPYATMEGWDEWENSAQQSNKFMHWVTDTLLNRLQDCVNGPNDLRKEIGYYINNRFFTKTHMAPTKLQKGKWHETDTRMLHSMFGLLVDFVEVESAWHDLVCDSKSDTRTWAERSKHRVFGYRDPARGIKHYEWARSLSEPAWKEHAGGLSRQAVAAEEILHLYAWWTITRPNRRDPYTALKWAGWKGVRRKDMTKEQKEDKRLAYAEVQRLEDEYDREDEEHMIRLIKVRRNLWT